MRRIGLSVLALRWKQTAPEGSHQDWVSFLLEVSSVNHRRLAQNSVKLYNK